MAEGRGMTKSTPKKYDDYEIRDAMHTMLRAGEIVKDKKLMGHVKKHAKEHAEKKHDEAQRAAHLAKSGRISDKAMAKMSGGTPGDDPDKMTPVA